MGQEQTRSLDALILEEVIRHSKHGPIDTDINEDVSINVELPSGLRVSTVPYKEARLAIGRGVLRGPAVGWTTLVSLVTRRYPLQVRMMATTSRSTIGFAVVATGYTRTCRASVVAHIDDVWRILEAEGYGFSRFSR